MEQNYTVEEASKVICEVVPAKIVDYFNNELVKDPDSLSELYSIIESWHMQASRNMFDIESLSLTTLIHFILDANLVNMNETEVHSNYISTYRNRKNYLFRYLQEEMGDTLIKPKNPLFMHNEWVIISSPFIKNTLDQITFNNAAITDSENDFKKKRYENAYKWFKNKSSYLFEFQYFAALSSKKRVDYFMIDLGLSILNIICKDFYRNTFGFITKTPDFRFGLPEEIPVVNWQAQDMTLQYEAKKDSIIVYESLGKPTNNVKIIVGEVPADCSTEESRIAAINRVAREYEEGKRLKTLDTLDFTIYTAILNNLTFKSLDGMNISMHDLAYDVFGYKSDIRLNKYEDLLRRLVKLASTTITATVSGPQGTMAASLVSFFDLTFTVQTKGSLDDASDKTITYSTGTESNIIDYNSFTQKDYGVMQLEIIPSRHLRDTWTNAIHTNVSSILYKQITSNKGKMLMQILQQERMNIYPNCEVTLNISYFKTKFKLVCRDTRFRNDLDSELKKLIEKKTIIEKYTIERNNFKICFFPLSTVEKIAFKISQND